MKTKLGLLATSALAALMFAGCGDETTQVIGTRTVAELDKSEVCTIGDMVVNLADNMIYVCDGARQWTTMKGDAGEKGETGAKGDRGEKGDAGAKGDPGQQGEQGIPGVKGENGSSCTARVVAEGVEVSCGGIVLDTLTNGHDGAQGPQGEQGPQGVQGETGAQGPQGATGAQGIQGVKGEDGSSCTASPVTNGVEIYCGGQLVATILNGQDGAAGESCTLASINVNGVHGVEITCGAQKDTVMNGAQGIQGVQGEHGAPGAAGASCSGVSLGDTAVVISCGDVVVDTLYNGAQGEQGIQGIQGEAGQSCTGLAIDGVGIEISCGGVVVDTLRNGNNNVLFCGNVAYDSNVRFCDERDNKLYKWVTIGTQTWMAENLNFGTRVNNKVNSKVNNQGNATAESAQKYCYNDSTKYCDAYGGLYQWHTAMAFLQAYDSLPVVDGMIQSPHRGICPAGWHIPDSTEWATLKTWVDNDNGGEENDEGRSLKSVSGWSDGGNGTNEYGFNALPGGTAWYNGAANDVGTRAKWWATSAAINLAAERQDLGNDGSPRSKGLSIRCIKD